MRKKAETSGFVGRVIAIIDALQKYDEYIDSVNRAKQEFSIVEVILGGSANDYKYLI